MAEKITPRVDLAFKKLFGVEENKDLLISLINSIVSAEDQVVEIDILNPYNPRNFRNDKLSILDIKAKNHTGKRYNIEIQISDEADYDKRALYYWAKLYTEQLEKSADYSNLNKAIGIHILNFTSILSTNNYHNVFQLLEKETKLHYFKDIELHTIELNKFENNSSQNQALGKAEELQLLLPKIKTSLDRWVMFLTRHDLLDSNKLPKEINNPQLKKALDVLELMNFTGKEREAYEEHLKWLRIEANTLKKAFATGKAKGKAEGKAEGLTEGKAEGKAEGLAEGLTKGLAEGETKGAIAKSLDIASCMLSKGMEIEFISKITGLTAEEINRLK